MVADMTGSVSLHQRLNEQEAERVIDRGLKRMTRSIEGQGGKVQQVVGDELLARFTQQGNRTNDTVVNTGNTRWRSMSYAGAVHRGLICVVFCLFGVIHGDRKAVAFGGCIRIDHRSEAGRKDRA